MLHEKKYKFLIKILSVLLVIILLFILSFYIKNKTEKIPIFISRFNIFNSKDSTNKNIAEKKENANINNTFLIISTTSQSLNNNKNQNNPYEKTEKKYGKYIKIINSCDNNFSGGCVRARACAGMKCETLLALRNNIVLKVEDEKINIDNINWYVAHFPEWRRYDDRLPARIYVSENYAREIESYTENFKSGIKTNQTNKKILIKLKEQRIYALENNQIYLTDIASTGNDETPTPIGEFQIYRKTPSRYMQGPTEESPEDYYDLPGVPWTMYFTVDGAAIHGAYWHNKFGETQSHGCINLNPNVAEKLYKWADLGTRVIIER